MKSRSTYTILFLVISIFGMAQESIDFSADRYFNQGNEAYNNNEFGEAVYQYEKALLLDPNAEDIQVNLKLAVERLDTDIIELEPFFLAHWWKTISNTFLPGTWKLLSITLLLLLLAIVFIYLFSDNLRSNLAYSLGGGLFFLILIFVLAGNTRANSIFENEYAVLYGSVKSLHEGPDGVSEEVKPVVSGVKVKILDSNAEWFKVATLDSEQGWVLKSQVRSLKFSK